VALSLEQEQGETLASDVWLGAEAAVFNEWVIAVSFHRCMWCDCVFSCA